MKLKKFDAVGETIYESRLSNGLQIYVIPRPGFAKKFAFFAANYGGNDLNYQWNGQPKEIPAGTAHFLEHKLFDTKEGSADVKLAAGGAIANAFTSPSMTAYFFECTEQFEENLDVLLHFVSEPYFTPESVQKEQGIIQQEIEMGADDPDTQVYYQLLECLFFSHPIRDRVIGTAESIAQLTPECLYACHEAFYHLDNMVLCVAGDVSPERIVEQAQKIQQSGGTLRHAAMPEEPMKPKCPRAERKMDVSAPQFMLGFKGTPETDQPLLEEIQAELALEALCGKSSPLYASLYEQGLIDKQFGYGFERYPGCSYFAFGGESKDPDAVVQAIYQRRETLLKNGLDEALFQQLKKAAYGRRIQELDSLENLCLSAAESHFRQMNVFEFPSFYEKLTADEIVQFISTAFLPERAALSIVLPFDWKEGAQ
jgi:predicted Zn-dependent peptidase